MLTDLLLGPLDHAVALAGHAGFHLASGGDLEALFGARLGLEFGHFALLEMGQTTTNGRVRRYALSELADGSASSPRQPYEAGRREAGVMAEAAEKDNRWNELPPRQAGGMTWGTQHMREGFPARMACEASRPEFVR